MNIVKTVVTRRVVDFIWTRHRHTAHENRWTDRLSGE